MIDSYSIACYAYETAGDWEKIGEKIKNGDSVQSFYIEEKYVTILDKEYPLSLRRLRYPPWVIFYEGDLSLLNKPMVSIVGSRKSTEYGERVTKEIARALSKDFVLVSGLAVGIDTIVHEIGILNGKTIGVLGSGMGNIYPKCNSHLIDTMKKKHLVISEYPSHTQAKRHHFPWRNRLIAALGDFCVVTQATYKSGTMLSVNEALELSKEVYCVPYPIGEEAGNGCNLLIQQGAQIIMDTENFFK